MNLFGTRYTCDILEDMRACLKTNNFSYLSGLIEEMQYRCNRMENALGLQGEIESLEERRTELKKETKELRKEISSLKENKEI